MSYKCCRYLLHGLCFYPKQLVSCCYSPAEQTEEGAQAPMIKDSYSGDIIPVDELFEIIHNKANVFKQGAVPKECTGCYRIEDKDWIEDNKINFITITHYSNCNANCVYCSNNLKPEERTNSTYKVLPFLKYLDENNALADNLEIYVGGGEFTIYNEGDEILDYFHKNKNTKIFVATNCIRYSESLFKSLDNNQCNLLISLDSGCSETYKKVKRVDAFNTIMGNLNKYVATETSRGNISLKYIIVPFYNDNLEEFKKFLNIAKKNGIFRILIDIDARYSKLKNFTVDNYMIDLAHKMYDLAVKSGFNTEFFTFMGQCFENKSVKSKSKLSEIINKYKFKFFNTDKHKILSLYNSEIYGRRVDI